MAHRDPKPYNRGSNGGKARAGRVVEGPAPRPRRLFVLSGWRSFFVETEPGQEDSRRECLNYERCLDAWDAFHSSKGARCPNPCEKWERPERGASATAYVSLNGAARGRP
jgi:hypothetical protein